MTIYHIMGKWDEVIRALNHVRFKYRHYNDKWMTANNWSKLIEKHWTFNHGIDFTSVFAQNWRFPSVVQVYVRDVTFILNKEDFVLGLRIFYIMDFGSDRNFTWTYEILKTPAYPRYQFSTKHAKTGYTARPISRRNPVSTLGSRNITLTSNSLTHTSSATSELFSQPVWSVLRHHPHLTRKIKRNKYSKLST